MAEWKIQELSDVRCSSCRREIYVGEAFALITQYKRPYCDKCLERMKIPRDETAIAKERDRLNEIADRTGTDRLVDPAPMTPMARLAENFQRQLERKRGLR